MYVKERVTLKMFLLKNYFFIYKYLKKLFKIGNSFWKILI